MVDQRAQLVLIMLIFRLKELALRVGQRFGDSDTESQRAHRALDAHLFHPRLQEQTDVPRRPAGP